MPTRRGSENRSDWQFAIEQIGRELRKLYPPTDTPPGWRALFREQRRRARAMHRNYRDDNSKDDGSPRDKRSIA